MNDNPASVTWDGTPAAADAIRALLPAARWGHGNGGTGWMRVPLPGGEWAFLRAGDAVTVDGGNVRVQRGAR